MVLMKWFRFIPGGGRSCGWSELSVFPDTERFRKVEPSCRSRWKGNHLSNSVKPERAVQVREQIFYPSITVVGGRLVPEIAACQGWIDAKKDQIAAAREKEVGGR